MHQDKGVLKKQKLRGFSLLELSIVIIILSIMLGGILTVLNNTSRANKQKELQDKLAVIENAIVAYRKVNNRLPCPGNLTLSSGIAGYGLEAANAGACAGGAPAANFSDGVNTVAGALPIYALNLSEDYMYDPWGGAFTYVVDARMTSANAFDTYDITNTTIGSITVNDAAGAARTTNAIVVVLSHGENGHGAFQASGARRSRESTNAGELSNCSCIPNGADAAFDAVFVQQAYTLDSADMYSVFDDSLVYYTRQQLADPEELQSE